MIGNVKHCVSCKRHWPLFLFKKANKGWYSRDGHNYCCRFCAIKNPVRYTKKKGKLFAVMHPYSVSIWYRLKEFFVL